MVKKYKKKPVVIESIQYTGDLDNFNAINAWACGNAFESIENGDNCLIIHTLEGDMKASVGDYIIKGVQGEFYPCKPDIFEQTYEEA